MDAGTIVCYTNPFLHSINGSIWTALTDISHKSLTISKTNPFRLFVMELLILVRRSMLAHCGIGLDLDLCPAIPVCCFRQHLLV